MAAVLKKTPPFNVTRQVKQMITKQGDMLGILSLALCHHDLCPTYSASIVTAVKLTPGLN